VSEGAKVGTPVGRLKITITNATIYHRVSSLKMDPYVIARLSSQAFTTKVAVGGDQ
jgi:hypothetical protein